MTVGKLLLVATFFCAFFQTSCSFWQTGTHEGMTQDKNTGRKRVNTLVPGLDKDETSFELVNKSGHDIWVYLLSDDQPAFYYAQHLTGRKTDKKKYPSLQSNIDTDRTNILYIWTSNPGDLKIQPNVSAILANIEPKPDFSFTFPSSKKLLLTFDDRESTRKKRLSKKRKMLYPQTGPKKGKTKVTESGLSLHNNIRNEEIQELGGYRVTIH